jgi:hypothetical protein
VLRELKKSRLSVKGTRAMQFLKLGIYSKRSRGKVEGGGWRSKRLLNYLLVFSPFRPPPSTLNEKNAYPFSTNAWPCEGIVSYFFERRNRIESYRTVELRYPVEM